ncbi:uncharacterized protein [Aegilops tauschii subsp. strangulata]|uniref:uncharacterized protein n=1 Tax=Aegilops tauschii subsp. strangulata TaxID=200361 RepID=UPI003CC8752B
MAKDPQVHAVFDSLVHWRVGDGATALFWKDRWMGAVSAKEVAPDVWGAVRTQTVNRRTVKEGLLNHRWTSDISGDLSTEGLVQFIRLWDHVLAARLDPSLQDEAFCPWNSKQVYTSASAYRMLFKGAINVTFAKWVWKCWAPLTCKIFMWLAIQYRIWTSDRRLRHGLQDAISPCYLCDQDEDAVDHLLVKCVISRQVWHMALSRTRLGPSLAPNANDILEHWWETPSRG